MRRICPRCGDVAKRRAKRWLHGNLIIEIYKFVYIELYKMRCVSKKCRHQFVLERRVPFEVSTEINEITHENFGRFNKALHKKPAAKGGKGLLVCEYDYKVAKCDPLYLSQQYFPKLLTGKAQ